MFNVVVSDSEGLITNSAKFAQQDDAHRWISEQEAMLGFGPIGSYSVEITDVSAHEEQTARNDLALKYLASTDWYCSRYVDEGKEIPDEVKAKRAEARAAIVR